eukprot:4471139-Pyramimonas_sp.AAC.1
MHQVRRLTGIRVQRMDILAHSADGAYVMQCSAGPSELIDIGPWCEPAVFSRVCRELRLWRATSCGLTLHLTAAPLALQPLRPPDTEVEGALALPEAQLAALADPERRDAITVTASGCVLAESARRVVSQLVERRAFAESDALVPIGILDHFTNLAIVDLVDLGCWKLAFAPSTM